MRIVIITQYFWPEPFQISDIAKSLSREGVEVTVITGKPNYPEGEFYEGYTGTGITEEVLEKVRIIRVPIYPRGKKKSLDLIKNYLSFIFSATLIAPIKFRSLDIDLILVYGLSPILQAIPALMLKFIKRKPLILYLQDLWPESLEATGYVKNKYVIEFIRLIVRCIYKNSDLILISSRPFSEHVKKISPHTKTFYLPNSAGHVFLAKNLDKKYNIEEFHGGFCVVFAGNIGKAQAMHVIIDAAQLLVKSENIKFIIIGDGSEYQWMKHEIKKRKLENIYLTGRYPVEAMPYFFSLASVMLVTLADYPIFAATVPSKIQAYMAAGRPIIAALNGEGARVVAEANAGVVVAAENACALAQAILDLNNLPQQELKQMGANARNYFEQNFDHKVIISRLMSQMKIVVGE